MAGLLRMIRGHRFFGYSQVGEGRAYLRTLKQVLQRGRTALRFARVAKNASSVFFYLSEQVALLWFLLLQEDFLVNDEQRDFLNRHCFFKCWWCARWAQGWRVRV